MSFTPKQVIQPEEFRLIREYVLEEFGLILDEARAQYLSSRLVPHITELGLESFLDYYTCLRFAPRGSTEHQRFISTITNNETYFFREDAQLKVFAEHIVPHLKGKKQLGGQRKFRIYSAGCSSGEEVYTLAMILLESGHLLWDWDIMVTGIDIDREMIARANEGVYSGRAFQSTPPHYLEKYFTRSGDSFQVKESLRKITRFEERNLLKLDPLFSLDRADVIFCRNVFIYFNDDTIRKIVDSFAELLQPEGFLFLGHSESLSRITSRYEPIRHPGAIVYRKRD
jgi:chemotaxis protein methyltransferase CheR